MQRLAILCVIGLNCGFVAAAKPRLDAANAWTMESIPWQATAPNGTKFPLLEGTRTESGASFAYAFFIPAGTWDGPHLAFDHGACLCGEGLPMHRLWGGLRHRYRGAVFEYQRPAEPGGQNALYSVTTGSNNIDIGNRGAAAQDGVIHIVQHPRQL